MTNGGEPSRWRAVKARALDTSQCDGTTDRFMMIDVR
jgi:hypothetical protein